MIPVLGVVAQDSGVKVAWPDLGGKEITIAVENAYHPLIMLLLTVKAKVGITIHLSQFASSLTVSPSLKKLLGTVCCLVSLTDSTM